MPPKLLFDLDELDLDTQVFGPKEIRHRNSQRHEMEFLDGVLHFDAENQRIVGEHRARDDEFWVRGHFPERPVFPGVLMIETAGQLCSFFYSEIFQSTKVMGFAACTDVKFRGTIVPGDRMIILCQGIDMRPRIAKFNTQVIVEGDLKFQGTIVGMPI